MRKYIIATGLLFFLTLTTVQATHMIGGDITWRCLTSGPNAGKVIFRVAVYRECGGASFQTSPITLSSSSPAGAISCSIVGTSTNVSPFCYSGQLACAGATSGMGAIEQFIFESAPVTLNGTPPATGWTFTWSLCCRPSANNFASQPDFMLRAVMYPFSPGGVGTPALNMNPCYDASPNFAEAPISVICSGYTYTYSHNAADADLDEMEYSLTSPVTSSGGFPGTPIPATNGYSWTLTGGPGPFPSSPPMQFSSVTGNITITPQIGGPYASCVKVQTKRCNQVIAEVWRDIPIVIRTGCPAIPPTGGSTVNTPPSVQLQNKPGFDSIKPVYAANGSIAYYKVSVFAGKKVSFGVIATEGQLLPTFAPQLIDCKPLGQQLGIPLNNPNSGCTNPPCATVKPATGQSSIISQATINEVVFEWQTDCGHVNTVTSSCGLTSNTYPFLLRMTDNYCPVPAAQTINVLVEVNSTIPTPPDLSSACVSRQSNGTIDIDWMVPADTGTKWDAYVVYHSTSSTLPFVALDTLFNFNQTTFSHTNPTAGTPHYYYMRSLGGCSLTSVPSDTISLIELDVTPFPPTNSYVAQLVWNARANGDTTSIYQVWRRGTFSAWSQIATTTNLNFNDTVNLCGDLLRYQVRINGACFSTLDSGQFSDQINTDALVIDSISVTSTGVVMAWRPSTSGDVVSYKILENQSGSWVAIVTLPAATPQPYTLPNINPSIEKKEYKIISEDSCGNQSSDLLVAYHNNIWLHENIDPCEGILRLRWNSYRGWAGGVGQYRVLADVTPPGGPTQIGVLLGTLTSADTTFSSRAVNSGWGYCFYVRAVDTAGTRFATSNQKCMNGLVVQRSRLLYAARTWVRADGAVDVVAFIDKDADIVNFDIQRADEPGMPFISLGKIPKPMQGPWEIRFTDYTAHAESHIYEYRFVATDSCGNIDTVSNVATTLLVQATAQDNLVTRLIWNRYRDFGGSVKEYQVWRAQTESGPFTLAATVAGVDTTHNDNIRPFGDNTGIYCYKVVAIEKNNPLGFVDYDGQPFKSTSGVTCVEYVPRIFIPNAFNPKSTNPLNRVWRPQNVYVERGSYELIIMDRWGNVVFQSKDETEAWDGNTNGKECPIGVYMYRMEYRSVQGEPQLLTGSVSLLR